MSSMLDSSDRRHRAFARLYGIVGTFAVLGMIEILIRGGILNGFIIPPPSDVAAAFGRLFMEEGIAGRFGYTAAECFAVMTLLVIFGVPGGWTISKIGILQGPAETWLAAWAAAPIVLLYPLFLVVLGRSAITIIAIGFVAAVSPVILKSAEAFRGTPKVYLNVGRSFNLTSSQSFWMVQLPAALPAIFTGLRLGLIFGLINVVGVEYLINFGGLGQVINKFAERYDLAGTYAAIAFVVGVSVLIFAALERLERFVGGER